jgi:SagB-type dehydrogenase family enzyme
MAAAPVIAGCASRETEENGVTTTPSLRSPIDFPEPTESSVPLEATLARRRSVRELSSERLTRAETGQLLWATQGVTADWGGRTAPSAGALYPLELLAATPTQVLHYLPSEHQAEITMDGDLRPDLMAAALDQAAVGQAPLVVAIAAVPARTAARYGERARRYVDLEAGHAAQNLLLQAVALDLAAVPIGAFDDAAVSRALALPQDHEPLYLIPVGHPQP